MLTHDGNNRNPRWVIEENNSVYGTDTNFPVLYESHIKLSLHG